MQLVLLLSCVMLGAPMPPLHQDTMNIEASGAGSVLSTSSMASPPAAPKPVDLATQLVQTDSTKEMLIAVVTAPTHNGARAAIRETYALDARNSGRARVLFFIGQIDPANPNRDSLERQIASEPNDVIRFSDFTESYHNLSSKALDIFKFAGDNGYKNVLKVDDDTYVRMWLALQYMDQNNDPYIYAGDFIDGNHAMVDDPNSKWYMKDQYPHDRLEDYANGPGVLLGSKAIEFFQRNHANLFRYRVDDAAIGIWLKDLPMDKRKMPMDHYSYTTHEYSVWINPVNSQEIRTLHAGLPLNPQICKETCLCWGGPQPAVANCLTWSKFETNAYKDMVPRMNLMQLTGANSTQ